MQNYGGSNPEMFSLQTGMEMLGMATTSKNNFNHGGDLSGQQPKYYHHHHQQSTAEINNNLVVVDDSSLRCLFPTQGPSLSLCNSTQGLIRGEDGFLMSLHGDFYQQQQEQGQGSLLLLQLSSCKYLIPTQELLKEFCNVLPTSLDDQKNKNKVNNTSEEEQEQSSSSSPWNHHHHLQSLGIPELQIRKARLLAMLEEVDRRFAKYCDQMRGVVSSFEAVTGEGFAAVYTTLASKAMSKHFRCLRDGIVGQIKVTRKAMAEKEQMTTTTARKSSTTTTTRGDQTPRLKLPEQCIRQHKAFRQGHSSEISHHHPWRPQRGLPERSVSILRAWLFEHFLNPYPSDVDKHILARQTGLSRSQVSNWFVNARVRLWKPMVEEMYMEETKEEDNQSSSSQPTTTTTETTNGILLQLPNPNYHYHGHDDDDKDQKPDQGSLSSIVNGSSFAYQFQTPTDDFSGGNRRFGSSSVSLTLGLQQHSGGGISGSGAMGNVYQSSFYSRSDDQQQQQQQNVENYRYVSFDGEAPQMNIPPPPPNYRNIMGAQLLRDFAG